MSYILHCNDKMAGVLVLVKLRMRVTYYYSFTKFLGTILLRDLSPAEIYAWPGHTAHGHQGEYISIIRPTVLQCQDPLSTRL